MKGGLWFNKESQNYMDYYENPKMVCNLNPATGAQIIRCIEKSTKEKHILKIITKNLLSEKGKLRLITEIKSLRLLQFSKYVVKLHNIYETEEELVISMEYLKGGTLFERSWAEKERHLSEAVTKKVAKQLLTVILEMKKKNILHRDLKPENIMCEDVPTENLKIKIIDFGFAKIGEKTKEGEIGFTSSMSGTTGYFSPERVKNLGSHSSEVWAAGIIIYFCLFCNTPFDDLTREEEETHVIFSKILNSPLSVPLEKHNISQQAQDFLGRLLDKDQNKRATIEEALNDPWLKDVEVTPKSKLNPLHFFKKNKGENFLQKEKETSHSFENLFKFIKSNDKKKNKK
eukprot:TRINITY_DN12635_c0_g1_i1.p1 TRINITY_DN12635_c0_g1~~TRINITY_DN12635_c0_g1_i1.p1  ORF type:complete len:393 (+),score=97.46 TRINITY_DN12635_c0_g1_i1:149-1180(+)